jgi:hypothetical protein
MDVYLRFVNAWYTKEFIEIFSSPRPVLNLPPAVNAVLGGNIGGEFAIKWRMWVFYFLVWVQRHYPIVPRRTLVPAEKRIVGANSSGGCDAMRANPGRLMSIAQHLVATALWAVRSRPAGPWLQDLVSFSHS